MCPNADIIENVFPICNIKVSVNRPKLVEKVNLVPEMQAPFTKQENLIELVVPEVVRHQIVEIAY